MKIAITTEGPELESAVDPRFGRARYFLVLDNNSDDVSVIDNQTNQNAAQGAGIQASRKLLDEGVQALITGHVGPKAFEVLQSGHVAVYVDAAGTAAEAYAQFNAGNLEKQEVAKCSGRRRGQGHGHHHGQCG